jgi:DHA1 family tetracycline resistance protein-like MFS transporter
MKLSKKILAFIFAVVLFDFIGLTILITVQAFIVREFNTTALAVSLLTVLYAASQFIAAPILGKISDRYGRRPILLFCLFGSAIGYFIFGIGGALWVLFLSRIIDGFTGGNVSIATAIITDVSPLEDRTKNLGLIGAAFGLGLIIGPILGGLFSQISLAAPAYAAGIFSLAATVVGFFILPESLPKLNRNHDTLKLNDFNPLSSIRKFITRPIVGIFLAVFIIVNFTFSGFTITLPVYVINKFAIDPLNIGGLLFVAGIVSSIVQGGLIGKLAKKFGDKKLLIVGILFLTSGLILFSFAQIFWLLYIILGIVSMGIGLITPTLNSQISKIVLPSELGEVFGVNTSLNSLMTIIGPLTAGLVYDYISPTAPYWLGAILLLIAFVLIFRIKAPKATKIEL